ncbi:hypothetical protein QO002_005243 [Pararhizobium capsulatum DSM 1112]|uniref:Uncharacterized protein n=1 Tax=Pararhizobium capsulatum DSM 1112 TaxID=1121113 RepID=A0ABU0BXP1_9HYPH|nr:hypothetical protein [Pararhizobium capsulatum DSM 1112]
MGAIFCRICPTPIRLPGLTFDHDVGPAKLLPVVRWPFLRFRPRNWSVRMHYSGDTVRGKAPGH